MNQKNLNKYRVVSNIESDKWNDFVKNHPKGNIFQTPEMFDIYSSTKNHKPVFCAALNPQSEIVGVLLAVIMKESSGVVGILSSRAIVMGGPIIKDDNPEILAFLLNSYKKIIKRKVIYTQVRNLYNQNNLKESFISEGFCYDPHLDILIDLNGDDPAKQMHKSKKRNFTKSNNKGLEFIEINNIEQAKASLKLISSTYKRVKLPMPDYSLFLNAFEILIKKEYLKIYGAFVDSKLVGVRWALTYKNVVYDWYAGSHDDYNNVYPNDFIIYNILNNGWLDKHVTIFDFGGAGKPGVPYGVRDHKLKFGGDLVEYGRFIRVNNKFIYWVGKTAIQLRKKLL